MRLSDYFRDCLIFLDIDAPDKVGAIAKTVEFMGKCDVLANASKFLQEVYQRESLGSTGIGRGVALPHARTQNVDEITITMTRLKEGVDFGAEDKENVRLIFLLATPVKAVGEYLKVLARLSKLLREDKIRQKLLKAQTPVEVRKIFEEAED